MTTVSVLFERSGSGVGEATVAVLVTVPLVEGFTVTLIITVALLPAGRAPRLQVTVPAAWVQGLPWEGTAPEKVRPLGSVSVTATDWASEGPLLVAVSV